MTRIKTLGILKTGEVKPEWRHQFGDYSEMFKELFRSVIPHLEFEVYDVMKEEYPQPLDRCDGYIITGSRHGVYEDFEWITTLLEQINALSAAGIPQAGICFGHQALATAFGGKVKKSPKGWGVGVHDYRIRVPGNGWEPGESFSILATHQDQAIEAPKDAAVLAESDFCPIAGLVSAKKKFISFQGHPEFSREFQNKLMDYRIKDIGKPVVEKARISLNKKTDETRIASSILSFVELHQNKSSA